LIIFELNFDYYVTDVNNFQLYMFFDTSSSHQKMEILIIH